MTGEDRGYQLLANAIVQQMVQDYEVCISDMPIPASYENVSASKIRFEAKHQWFTPIDVVAVLDKIDRVYKEKFRPYCLEHADEIIKDYNKLYKKYKGDSTEIRKHSTHKCPFCKGTLKPIMKNRYITCSFCYLNVRVKK